MEEQINILVIYTGGTIGMIQDPKTGRLTPFNFDGIYDQIPELKRFDYHLEFYSFDPLIDSSNTRPEYWVELARVIEENYDDYEGFVVLHGTDTMSYTASALSFMFENLNKPVIFTGSQLPLRVLRTDGRDNFITAIELAARREGDVALVPEVCIYFENRLMRANRTVKYNTENFNAFISPNYPLLAEAGIYLRFYKHDIFKANDKKLKVYKKLDNHVGLLKLFPGIPREYVYAALTVPNQKAIVLETYGSGNAPTEAWFIDALKQCIDSGTIVVNVTQCMAGSVEMGHYDTSVLLKNIGVLNGFDSTTEAMLSKIMHLLGRNLSKEQFINFMNTSLRGEITVL